MPITDVILARADHSPKERAAAALADMGFSISDAIRLLMVGAGDRKFPPELSPPGAIASRGASRRKDRQAMAFTSIEKFMADLRNDSD